MTTKKKKTGEYRNLKRQEADSLTWEFEVKLKDGSWKHFTGLRSNEEDAMAFAQNTADGWMKK